MAVKSGHVQGCFAVLIGGIQICLISNQQSQASAMAVLSCQMQGCFSIVIGGIQIRPIFNQLSQAFVVAVTSGQMQGCFAAIVAGIDLLFADFKHPFQVPAMPFGCNDMQRCLTFFIGFVEAALVEKLENSQRTFTGNSVQHIKNICTMLFQNTSALDVSRRNNDAQGIIKDVKVVRSRLDQGRKALRLPPLGSSTQGFVKVVRSRCDQDSKTLRLPPLGGFAQSFIKGKWARLGAAQILKQWSIAPPG
nr:hypothetical protein [Endozoicomonas acroporae]